MVSLRQRVGNWVLKAAQESAGMDTTVGASGFTITGGKIDAGEFNKALTGVAGAKVFDQMRRESSVATSVKLINLPVLGAEWFIEAEDDGVKDFLTEALFKRLDWEQFLQHCLLCFVFGFEVMEKVWERDGGKIWLQALQHRSQRSITKWFDDADTGELTGIEQQAQKGGTWGTFQIPQVQSIQDARAKLFHIALGQEGNNFAGTSGLRPAYPYWKAKTDVFNVAVMGVERFGLGVPMAEAPVDESTGRGRYSPKEKDSVEEMLRNFQAGAQSFIFNPGGWTFSILGAEGGNRYDPLALMEYCDDMIAANVLGEFTRLGVTRSGARAVAEPQIGVYMLAEEAIAELIRVRVDEQLIRPLLEYNYPNADKIAAGIKWADLQAADPTKIANYVEKLTRGGLLTPDEELESHLRTIGDLPATPGQVSQAASERPASRNTVSFAESSWWRDLTEAEQSVAFRAIDGEQDDAVDEIAAIFDAVQPIWIDDLGRQILEAAQAGDVETLGSLAVSPKLQTLRAKDIEAIQREQYQYGIQTVRDEERRQARRAAAEAGGVPLRDDELDRAEVFEFFATRSARFLSVLAARTASIASEESLSLYRTMGQDVTEGDVDEIQSELSSLLTPTAMLEARVLISEAVNLGRNKQAEFKAEAIKYAEYSAILDSNVCTNCKELDGDQYEVGSREYYADLPPNRQCLSTLSGSNRCRCIMVYVFKTEQEASR